MSIKEIFNAVLSLRRLTKVTAVEIGASTALSVTLCVIGAWVMGNIVLNGGMLAVRITLYCIIYVCLLYIINAVTRDDIKWAAGLVSGRENKSLQM